MLVSVPTIFYDVFSGELAFNSQNVKLYVHKGDDKTMDSVWMTLAKDKEELKKEGILHRDNFLVSDLFYIFSLNISN